MRNLSINGSMSFLKKKAAEADGVTAAEPKVLCLLVLQFCFRRMKIETTSAKYNLYDWVLQRNIKKELLAADVIDDHSSADCMCGQWRCEWLEWAIVFGVQCME